jgi:hypothetical protein
MRVMPISARSSFAQAGPPVPIGAAPTAGTGQASSRRACHLPGSSRAPPLTVVADQPKTLKVNRDSFGQEACADMSAEARPVGRRATRGDLAGLNQIARMRRRRGQLLIKSSEKCMGRELYNCALEIRS